MKKVVTIGGGTGSFTLLSGLKKYPLNITAIVSMADDGGSTGRLRDELGVLPPGDVRQCLVALSNSSDILRKLMNYRFEKGGLKGHNFGNLFLSALEKITGKFSLGVEEATRILNVTHKVLPVSEEKMTLYIKLNNGKTIKGEKQLDHNKLVRKFGIKEIYLKPKVKAYEKAIKAIEKANFIIIGPGDHYGSILPNLLIRKISQAIQKSKAKVIYVCNLTNKKGQTEGFDLNDYVNFINEYIGKNRIDYVVYNIKKPAQKLIAKYEKIEGKNSLVTFDIDKCENRNYKVVKANILKKSNVVMNKNDAIKNTRSFIRHDSDKLAQVLVEIFNRNDRSIIKDII